MRVAHWRAMLRCVQPRATQRLAPRKWGLRERSGSWALIGR